jgi:protein-tyrosine phosphatase
VDEPIASYARVALEEVGVYPGDHRARQVDKALPEEHDVVLTMTTDHKATLRRLSEVSSAKVHTLLVYASDAPESEGVPDPYGQSILVHRASVRQPFQHINSLVERLTQEDRAR